MKKTILYLCFFFFAFSYSVAQEKTICKLKAGKTNVYTKISAPSIYIDRMVLQKVATGKLVANYTINVPTDVEAAVDTAVGIWNSLLNFSTQVDVKFDWVAMIDYSTGNPDTTTLGSTIQADPIFYNDKAYPPALANAIIGSDQNIFDPEIEIILNSNFSWYKKLTVTGTYPAYHYDLISVVLHEIGHGLGWTGSFGYDSSGVGYGA